MDSVELYIIIFYMRREHAIKRTIPIRMSKRKIVIQANTTIGSQIGLTNTQLAGLKKTKTNNNIYIY